MRQVTIEQTSGEFIAVGLDQNTMKLTARTNYTTWDVTVGGIRLVPFVGEGDSDPSNGMEVSPLDVISRRKPDRPENDCDERGHYILPVTYFQLLGGKGPTGDGRSGAQLDVNAMKATPVDLRLDGPKLSGAYLSVKQGEVCAIMGMSGCGKSLFFEVLAGVRRPDPGKRFDFWFDASADEQGQGSARKLYSSIMALDPVDGVNKIAFVRQEDPLLGDLTLVQSLTSRCRLMWPWMSHEVVQRTVRSAAGIVAPDPADLDSWMAKRIGAPLDRDGVMSGGQRRRASIAHELIGHPLAVLMDEPTSGLSSSDAYLLVKGLTGYAMKYGIPVVMSVHQPPRDVFVQFHSLLIMAKPGRVLFHGPRRLACRSLFEKVLKARQGNKFADGSLFKLKAEQTNEELETCIKKLGFCATFDLIEENEDVTPMVAVCREGHKAGLKSWIPDSLLELRKKAENREDRKEASINGEEANQVLLSKDPGFWNTNPADAIADFLAFVSEKDAEVLGNMDRIEGEEAPPKQEDRPMGDSGSNGNAPQTHLAVEPLNLIRSTDRLLRIWWELAKRSVCVLRRDKGGFAFLVLQGIILALLLLLSFHDHGSDRFGALDLFAGTVRTNKQFDDRKLGAHDSSISKIYQMTNWFNTGSPLGTNAGATGAGERGRWKRLPESKEWKNPWYLDGHGRHRGTVLFVVAFAVLWMAVVGGAREISQDYPVIIHEGKLGVGPAAVALSRFAVLWAMSCWHAIPLVVAGGMLVEERAVSWYVEAWLSMACLGGLATASGLLISAWSRSQRMALVIVPFVTVPQVLFAGVLQSFPIAGLGINGVAKVLPLRLGWEALLRKGRLWTEGVVQFEWKGVDTTSNDAMGTFIKSTELRDMGWQTLYFGNHVWGVDPRWVMAGCSVGIMAMVWWRLRWRIDRGVQG